MAIKTIFVCDICGNPIKQLEGILFEQAIYEVFGKKIYDKERFSSDDIDHFHLCLEDVVKLFKRKLVTEEILEKLKRLEELEKLNYERGSPGDR